MRQRHDLLHQLQRLDRGVAGEVEQALRRVDVAAHAVRHRRQRAPAMRIEGGAERRGTGIDDRLGVGQVIVPGRRGRIGQAGLGRQARMPRVADHIEQERPAVHLAVDRVLFADRRDDVVEHVLRDVVVPRLDDVGFDHRRHFDERRLADIDVPGAFAALRLGHEALDAETFDRRDLVVDAGEFLVHRRDAGMKVLDPLIEGRRQRTVLRKGRSDAHLRRRRNAGHAEAGHQASRDELTPVDVRLAAAAGALPPAGRIPVPSVRSSPSPPRIGSSFRAISFS